MRAIRVDAPGVLTRVAGAAAAPGGPVARRGDLSLGRAIL